MRAGYKEIVPEFGATYHLNRFESGFVVRTLVRFYSAKAPTTNRIQVAAGEDPHHCSCLASLAGVIMLASLASFVAPTSFVGLRLGTTVALRSASS